ncbi:MAG: ABC transporter substrate-binding protein [Myxococcota bacterium]
MRILPLLLLLGCNPDPYPGEQGDILHISLRQLPKSMDPPQIEDEGSGKVSANVYDGLLQYHPFARPYQLEPALAEAMPEMAEDGVTYTFRIKRGVRFHDDPCFPDGRGRELTAHDFVWAYKRLAHPTVNSRGWWLFDGRIEGLDAWRDGLRDELKGQNVDPAALPGMDREVGGLKALDDHTLQIRLTGPYPQFLWTLAMGYASVYPHEAIEHYGAEYRNHPVGTGPFRITEYNPVYRAVFERNPTYREDHVPDPENVPSERWTGWEQDVADGLLVNAGEAVPLLDGMEMRFILEDQPRWLYFKNGYTDFLNPPKDNIAEAIPGGELSDEMKSRGIRIQRWTELGTVYACMNTEDPLLSNVDVRRAIALAYDHAWTIENLYGDQAILAKSLIPPGIAGFDGDYHPFQAEDGHADVERAKEYLAKAGYPDGIDPKTGQRLHLTFENSGSGLTQRQFADRFTDEMRRIGIDVDSVTNTFPQLTDKMRKKKFQITSLAWGFDYPDAQNILQLLYGPNKAPGVGSASFDNPEFDALYEEAAKLPDGPVRTALYEEMAHIVADQVPWVTRVHRIRPNLQQPWLQGYKYTEVSDQYWRYVGVDDAERDRLVAEWNQPTRWPLVLFGVVCMGVIAISVRRS